MLNTFRGYKEFEIGGALRPFHIGTNQAYIFCREKAKVLYDRARTDEARERYSFPLEPDEYNDIFFIKEEDSESVRLKKISNALTGENWILLVYSCLIAGYEISDTKPDFKLVHVMSWLDHEAEWKVHRAQEFVNFFYGTHTENTRQVRELKESRETVPA